VISFIRLIRPLKMSVLENLGLVTDSTPHMDIKNDSEEKINSFLNSNLEKHKEEIAFLFVVGPFICGLEPSNEERIRFWILNMNHELAELTDDSSFESRTWMSYYNSDQKTFKIPLSELHKIIQHLIRLSRLSSFF